MANMLSLLSYEGKRAIVTGGTSGIGRATVDVLAELGAEVFALGRRPVEEEGATGEAGGQVRFLAVDISSKASIDQAVAEIGSPVHALFNCAGAGSGKPSIENFLVNFCGTRHLIESVIPLMPRGSAITSVTTGWASIRFGTHIDEIAPLVATASFEEAEQWVCDNLDRFGPTQYGPGATAYAFSKEAICMYTTLKARELGPLGIRINTVGSGSTETPMLHSFFERGTPEAIASIKTPMERFGQPQEQAYVLAFMNSSAASFVSGADLIVDGAYYASIRPDLEGIAFPAYHG